jgi:hypothetical protein
MHRNGGFFARGFDQAVDLRAIVVEPVPEITDV